MYLLGYDIGSSSVKVALVDAATKKTIATHQSPSETMPMQAEQPGWAEQDPAMWWEHVCKATKSVIAEHAIDPGQIKAIGIAYQMHGLVILDADFNVLRPSIIWCDSRAVTIGNEAFDAIGHQQCLNCMLNSPGNFTASKLKWVQQNEPELYDKVKYFMLPGDYIAFRFTGQPATTASGLSEGILWDFQKNGVSDLLLDHFGIDKSLVPPIVPTLARQGTLTRSAAAEAGLVEGIPVTYRAGDQPNNAMSLNVLNPGEIAATGGTSGVVYGVIDYPTTDPTSRINGFAHVNHTTADPRIGVLLCINGAGILYSWTRQQIMGSRVAFSEMEKMASSVPIGAQGLNIIPFGNGAERILENKNPGAQMNNLQLNIHERPHLIRAALEGIAFSFVYGMEILQEMGLQTNIMRVGNDNLFQSSVFSHTIASLTNSHIEVMQTTGAVGAAKASGVAAGLYSSLAEAMEGNELVTTYHPVEEKYDEYQSAYQQWKKDLARLVMKKQ